MLSKPTPEFSGINLYSERSLHASLKAWLAGPGDRLEVRVGRRVVDLVRADGELVEIQTRSLGALLPKLRALLGLGHRVRVVYPLLLGVTIVRADPDGGEASRRRSPKRRDLYSVFEELVRASALLTLPGLTLEVVSVRVAELRVRDGRSWRRRGDRTADRVLESVEERREFRGPADWLALLPHPPPWDSGALGAALGIAPARARKVLYALARAGLIREVGKTGRRKVYSDLPA